MYIITPTVTLVDQNKRLCIIYMLLLLLLLLFYFHKLCALNKYFFVFKCEEEEKD